MKKNILLSVGIAIIICGGINSAPADTFMRSELSSYANQDPILVAKKLEEKSNYISEQINLYLDHLLKIPFEQRQYLFPGLLDIPNMPKKIRTHPEIAIWKGKMPTDIDPEKKELADKYMKDLNPAFYILLAPKYIQTENDIPSNSDGMSLFPGNSVKVIQKVEKYPTVYEALKQPENLQKNPDLSILSEDDIKKIDSGVKIFGAYLKKIQNSSAAFEKYQLLSKYYTDSDKERINPFQAKVERLKLIKQVEKLDQELRQIGFKSAEDFGIKTDALVKAYRAARMSYAVAVQARRYKDITPQNKIEKMLVLGSQMHQAYPKDVQLVLENLETVRQIFIKNGFQSVLDAETFDAFRK